MATFKVYAKVLTPDDPAMQMFAAGITKQRPGQTLEEILQRTGGVFETTVHFSPELRKKLRDVAALSSDKRLLDASRLSEWKVSLEHLRNLDRATLIAVRTEISYTQRESELLGLGLKGAPDPRSTILYVNPD
jgi:hypothetical protein